MFAFFVTGLLDAENTCKLTLVAAGKIHILILLLKNDFGH